MAVLKLQSMRPTVAAYSAGVSSLTSSVAHCCNKDPD
ncbi:class III lanthipeptide [Streptomyces vilmorinianum]|nr:class III lanthipeptide [Streptomyces vilmorinianum]